MDEIVNYEKLRQTDPKTIHGNKATLLLAVFTFFVNKNLFTEIDVHRICNLQNMRVFEQ